MDGRCRCVRLVSKDIALSYGSTRGEGESKYLQHPSKHSETGAFIEQQQNEGTRMRRGGYTKASESVSFHSQFQVHTTLPGQLSERVLNMAEKIVKIDCVNSLTQMLVMECM